MVTTVFVEVFVNVTVDILAPASASLNVILISLPLAPDILYCNLLVALSSSLNNLELPLCSRS